jgi:hypothetical protein
LRIEIRAWPALAAAVAAHLLYILAASDSGAPALGSRFCAARLRCARSLRREHDAAEDL